MPKQNNSNSIQKSSDEQQANNDQQGKRQDPKQKTMNIPREDTGYDMEEQSESQTTLV